MKQVLVVMLLPLVLAASGAIRNVAADERGSFELEFDAGRVSLVATQAPAIELLSEFGRQADFAVRAQAGSRFAPVTLELHDVALSEALDRLLAKLPGHVVIRDPGANREVREIHLIEAGPSAPTTALPPVTAGAMPELADAPESLRRAIESVDRPLLPPETERILRDAIIPGEAVLAPAAQAQRAEMLRRWLRELAPDSTKDPAQP